MKSFGGGGGVLTIFVLKILGKFRGRNLIFEKFDRANLILFENFRKFLEVIL